MPQKIVSYRDLVAPGSLQLVVVALGEHAGLGMQATSAPKRRYVSAADMTAFTPLSTQAGALAHGRRRSSETPR